MNIKIFTDVKGKSNFFKEASKEYIKRISRFGKVQFLPLSKLKDDSPIYISHEGTDLTSVDLSEVFSDEMMRTSEINIVVTDSTPNIGESRKTSGKTLRLTSLTLDPQLELILLLEQIYRSFKILNNETYHK